MAIINRRSPISNPRGRCFPARAIYLPAILFAVMASCARRPAPPAPYLAFVVCQGTNSVAVVNLAEMRVVASLAVSPGPEEAHLRPGGEEIYVSSPTGIDRIRVRDFQVRLNDRSDTRGRSLVFSPNGQTAYYLLESEPQPVPETGIMSGPPVAGVSHIGFMDTRTGKEVGQLGLRGGLSRLAITADGRTLLASDPLASALHFFDAASRKHLGAVAIGAGAGPIAVQPFGSKAFVSNTGEEKVSVVDTGTRQVLAHIELGMRPGSLLLKPDGGELFVLCPGASMLAIVDAFHDNVVQTLPAGRNPVAGVFRKDSSVLYLANAGDGSVMILDVQNRTMLASTQVGREPRALALTPDERFLAVADSSASSLAILIADPARLAQVRSPLVTTIPVGARPVDVVIPDWLAKQ